MLTDSLDQVGLSKKKLAVPAVVVVLSMKRIAIGTVVLLIILVLLQLGIYYRRDLPRRDLISMLIFPDDTVYAPQFTESAFVRVRVGMNVSEAIELLGKPLSIDEYANGLFLREMVLRDNEYYVLNQSDRFAVLPKPDKFIYAYSTFGPKYDNYHIRIIVISAQGIVTAINNSFYEE